MKLTMVFALLVAILFSSCESQELKTKDVPLAVQTAFTKAYPDVQKVEWEKEDAGFEAEFEQNGEETSVVYNAAGQLLETEVELPLTALPKAVKTAIARDFATYKLKEAARVSAADGTVLYEAELQKGKEKFDAMFSTDGQLMKKINKKKESDDDNNGYNRDDDDFEEQEN